MIGECVKLTEGTASERRLSLVIHCENALPALLGDEMRLKQIVLNLVSNAIKFTLPGGEVSVGAESDVSGALHLIVRDNGIGMAPEMIPIALEPFRQLGSPRARRFEGSGLGLSLVKSLAEMHQAELRIQSEIGIGTEVRVQFPVCRSLPFHRWASPQEQLAAAG